jgi:GNAT superfamily N-acetyltransferase
MLSLRKATPADKPFAYDVRKSAFGDYIRQTFGWDESFQRHFHEQDYDTDTTDVIVLDGLDIGILRVRRASDAMHLDQILILPLYQRRGYGSQLIQNLFEECKAANKPLRLQYLADNPVGRLYVRLGFRQTGESPPHLLAEWSPANT